MRPPAALAASASAIAFVSYAPPDPACHSFPSPGLSSTVVVHAFASVHRPGSSTLFGLAVSFQHVALQSSHGGGPPRITPLPISSPLHTTLSTVLKPVRPTLHPSSLASHDITIATLQDRSAWHGLVAPCFPHQVGLTACLDELPRLLCECRHRRKGLVTRQSQAHPASAGGPSPHVSPRRHPRGVASLKGWGLGQDSILGSIRCGGTGLPQASGLFVSLPFRRAIARLVPSVCGTLTPREGGLHSRFSHRIVHHAMAKQLPLS